MRSRTFRRGLTAVTVLGLVTLAGIAALPLIASTQIVKDHIALELSRWSGYRVTLGKAPVIRLWPSLRAVLGDVRMSEWGGSDIPAVLSSDIVEMDLSAFAALRGRVEPRSVRFVRPLLRLRRHDGYYYMPPAVSGRFQRAVSTTSRLLGSSNGEAPAGLPAESVGTIEVSEGRIVVRDDATDAELLSSLSGTVHWPAMNRELTFRAAGIWRGENISVSGSLTSPLVQFAGGNSPMRISLESAPLTGSFIGVLDVSQLEGDLTLSSPSLGRTLEWIGTEIGAQMPSGAVALSGTASGNLRRMRIEQAKLTLGGNPGSGMLDFELGEHVPSISGTLAFDDLDLLHVLGSYSILPDASLNSQLADLLNLDLRLSAVRAAAGPINLANVAAVVQLNDRLVTFDISDSTAFGGNVLTGIRIDRKSGTESAEFRLLANEIDGAALASATAADPWLPKARGKISVILKGPLALPMDFFGHASGSIHASFAAGTFGTFDLDSFLQRALGGGFFSLDDVEKGTVPFDRAELKAAVIDGVASIEKAVVSAAGRQMEFGGVANYGDRSLALAGSISPLADSADAADVQVITFFAGGSWDSPYFSAILPASPAQRAAED